MDATCRIDEFDSETLPEVGDIVQLHTELLPRSPVVLLGERFMRDFYYAVLPRELLMFGAVGYVHGVPAGFVVATRDPRDFMRRAVRKHWRGLARTIGSSLVSRKGRPGALLEAWRIMSSMKSGNVRDDTGEILSLGVHEAYRCRKFVQETNIRLPRMLLDVAIRQLRDKGVHVVRAVVDEDNMAARLFYHAQGWAPSLEVAKGWRRPTVEFLLRL